MVQLEFSSTGGDKIINDLERFRVNLTQAKPAFEKMADIVAKSQQDQFNTEGKHYGSGWEELSPAYRNQKARRGRGNKILEDTGNLRDAAAPQNGKGFSFYKVTKDGMEVGLDYRDVPYGKYHQEGTNKMPARPIVGQPTKEDQKAMTKVIHEHILGGTSHARR